MGILERFQERKTQKDIAGVAEQSLKVPLTKEILADKTQSRLFGMYLEAENASDMAQRLINGELTSDDFQTLEEYRQTFLERLERVENLKEAFGPREVEELVAHSPYLKDLAGAVGTGDISRAILKHLPEIAMREPDRFDDLDAYADFINENAADTLEKNKEIAEFCKQYKLEEEDFLEALESADPAEALKKRLSAGLWFFKKYRKAKIAYNIEDLDLEGVRKLLDRNGKDIQDLGRVLQAFISENKEVRETLTASLRQEAPEKAPETVSFKEMKNSMNAVLQEKGTEEAWTKYKVAHPIGNGVSMDDLRSNFSRDLVSSKLPRGRKGLWGNVLEAMLVPDIMKTLF